MDMTYEDVLARLKEERFLHKLSQEEMGRRLRMTQGHYSKAEQAIKRFTYYEMKCLADSELDLYYIYTGRRAVGRHWKILRNCGYKELLCYLHILISMECCRYGERKQALEVEKYRRLCRLKFITGADEGRENVFLLIRRYEKRTQNEMAEHLGMDVKKYRGMEKGCCLPDSELIFKIYSVFGVSPAYILRDEKGLFCEIEYYLERFDPKSNGVIYRYFCLLRDAYAEKKNLPSG